MWKKTDFHLLIHISKLISAFFEFGIYATRRLSRFIQNTLYKRLKQFMQHCYKHSIWSEQPSKEYGEDFFFGFPIISYSSVFESFLDNDAGVNVSHHKRCIGQRNDSFWTRNTAWIFWQIHGWLRNSTQFSPSPNYNANDSALFHRRSIHKSNRCRKIDSQIEAHSVLCSGNRWQATDESHGFRLGHAFRIEDLRENYRLLRWKLINDHEITQHICYFFKFELNYQSVRLMKQWSKAIQIPVFQLITYGDFF